MRAVAVLGVATLGALGGWSCVGTGLTEPTGFARFEFERIGLSGGTPDIRRVTIEQQTADDWQLTATFRRPSNQENCGTVEDCYETITTVPRALTPEERDTLGDIFSSVRWETTADTETCPLWDPAFIDSFRWDAVEISTNLCQAPYLGFEQSQAITEGLFPLVLIDTTP